MNITTQSDQELVVRGTSIVGDLLVLLVALAICAFCIAAAVAGSVAALIPAALAVVVGGLVLWMVHHRTEARFDKDSGEFNLRRKMLHKTFERQVKLEDIVQADVDRKTDRTNDNQLHPRYSYRLCVVTGGPEARERLPIGHGFSNNRGHKVTAEKINAWLGVPDAPVGHGPGFEDVQKVVRALGLNRASSR